MNAVGIILIIIGAIALLDGAMGGITTNFNIGFIAEVLAGAVCLALGVFWNRAKKWIKAAVMVGIAVVLCCCLAVWLYGTHDTANYNEDILIVLGAAVHGETPSNALINRLDAAVEYLNENIGASVIVTGGQGAQENVTEAAAMEKYLTEHGIAKERIIKEEKATSTSENYRYSKEIIDEHFPSAEIVTITNDFHVYRAKRLAAIEGLETSTMHAKTPLSGIAAMYLREILAVAKLWVFGA